ncbi:2-oxoacid:acceptor oxidoreductase family protein [Haloplasma contractile]|uniref:2-oxoacid:acceptor oxidoreductase family protein n=1 Tax=Haloplasma contractile TaxID=471825 RepID=UPI00058DCE27
MNEKVIIAGFGGQGVMLMGQLLAYAANEQDLNTLWYPSYGPETRGGTANCSVTISDTPVNSPVISLADTIIVMNGPSLDKFEDKVKPGGKLFINSSIVDKKVSRDDIDVFYVPVNDMAVKLGNSRVANMVMLSAYLGKTELFENELILNLLRKSFGERKAHLIEVNEKALEEGRTFIAEYK